MSREPLPFDANETQTVGEALFGTCKLCHALLEVDGSCPFAHEHPKHECPKCGAEHDGPVDEGHPCLFCGDTLPAPKPHEAA